MRGVFSVVSISQGHADLHTHTHYSGFNIAFFIPYPESVTPPERMVDAAVKKGLDVLCITDHDEIEGALRAQRYSRKEGLETEVVVSQNDPLGRVYQMRRRNKVIAIGGCIAFMATPLPFVCGMVGEGWIRWKGRRKWQEVSSEWIIEE